ncbi:MAG: 50S ribosomal protein L32 [Planctomycetota bacterium]|nr:50S ribosomal protein L32 [Planctomycetota bacterium]
MAVPRHKTSKMRQRTRRAHNALTPAGLYTCPRCSQEKLPHRVCDKCGYYNNVEKMETGD